MARRMLLLVNLLMAAWLVSRARWGWADWVCVAVCIAVDLVVFVVVPRRHRLFMWSNDHDWLIAADEADAVEVYRDHIGRSSNGPTETGGEWFLLDDDKSWTMLGYGVKPDVTKTHRAWADEHGRGYLGSEDGG